jgi:mevalonate kinase
MQAASTLDDVISASQLTTPRAADAAASIDLHVTGRLCVVGEHSDWSGRYRVENDDIHTGCAIIVNTSEGFRATVTPLAERRIVFCSRCESTAATLGVAMSPDAGISSDGAPEERDFDMPLVLAELSAVAASGGWWSYVAGTAAEVLTRFPRLVATEGDEKDRDGGIVITETEALLAVSKGLSSSAAICVLTARAFNRLFSLGWSLDDEMDVAFHGELRTPSKCGRLDQAVAFGAGAAVHMLFDGDDVCTSPLAVPHRFHLVIADLCASKDTTQILRDLQSAFPVAKCDGGRRLHALLGSVNAATVALVRDVLTSTNEANGDDASDADPDDANASLVLQLGKLLVAAQADFDGAAVPMSKALTAPRLREVLSFAATDATMETLVAGGKGVGSQGDGTAQFVCYSAAAATQTAARLESECQCKCVTLSFGGGLSK